MFGLILTLQFKLFTDNKKLYFFETNVIRSINREE